MGIVKKESIKYERTANPFSSSKHPYLTALKYEAENNPAHPLRKLLFRELEKELGLDMTKENIINAINRGIGEEYVLKLQGINVDNRTFFHLKKIFPDDVLNAILEYSPKH